MSIAEFVPAPRIAGNDGGPRHDWTRAEIGELFALPFPDLKSAAQTVHRDHAAKALGVRPITGAEVTLTGALT